MNKAAEKLTGYRFKDVKMKYIDEIYQIFDENSYERIETTFLKVIKHLEIQEISQPVILKDCNGLEKLISETGAPIINKNGALIGVLIAFRDISEKRKTELEIARTHKLESIGILAGGIAHDFNNLLTGILGNMSIALIQDDVEKIKQSIRNSEKATNKAIGLTHQLLTFSKGGSPVRENGSIVELLYDAPKFSLRGSNVSCKFEIDKKISNLNIDSGQISQVINNLIINASQAMPEGGKIMITARNIYLDSKSSVKLQLNEGKYIKISIQDEGIGIPVEFQKRIFDPYFTTKKTGHGLGLYICYSIIKNHNGIIELESQVGVGTVFHIYLPAHDSSTVIKQKTEETELVTGTEKILVMDDDKIIRDLLEEILKMLGYDFDFVEKGEDAIEFYQVAMKNECKYDLVIMDLTIPGGMGGKEAIVELKKIDPAVKAIVVSGYSTSPVMSSFQDYGFKGMIQKPFNIKKFGETLRLVIDS